MMTKTIDIELDEDDLLNDMDPDNIISYLSYNDVNINDIPSLAEVVNNSLLNEEEIKEFLKNLDYEIFKEIKKIL
ncbi:hypothetical protein [Campylobacter ureolyticus]|uniref:hypothetical protein n=1 Tax=Campylobacter ureolyticus TaxID=827 RepID=UPI00290E83CA|nr:hypothetical protein [Campylobacter ureolyticus]MDU7070049.1 hypothetical protein [Campylobacter ureolyticus]